MSAGALGHRKPPRHLRLPDAHAHGKGAQAQPLYCVRFSAAELWGKEGDPRSVVYVDLWEDYLEAAPASQANPAGAGQPARAPDA